MGKQDKINHIDTEALLDFPDMLDAQGHEPRALTNPKAHANILRIISAIADQLNDVGGLLKEHVFAHHANLVALLISGKPKKVARFARMRKLLVILNPITRASDLDATSSPRVSNLVIQDGCRVHDEADVLDVLSAQQFLELQRQPCANLRQINPIV